jgi:curli biogenesis system outer membrane secretion channel CsgG
MSANTIHRFAWGFVSCLVAMLAAPLQAQEPAAAPVTAPPAKLSLAVGAVKVTPALVSTLEQRGQARELGRVQESLDPQLTAAFQATRKFDLVARTDLKDVILEQDLSGSGNVDKADPAAAKAFKLAGARYVVVSTIDDFQDNVQEAEFKEIGKKATRRQVRLSVIAKIYDTTTGRLLESANLQLDNSAFVRNPEFLTGEKGSNLTEKALQELARQMAEKVAARVVDVLLPAKVLAVRDGQVTLNRGDGTGIAVGQAWAVFAQGGALIDPDTGENLGSEEVRVGSIRITSVLPKTAVGELCGENRGVAKGCILRVSNDGCGNVAPTSSPAPPPPPVPQASPGAVRGFDWEGEEPPALPPLPASPAAAPATQSTAPTKAPVAPAGNPPATTAAEPTGSVRPVAAIFVKNRGCKIDPEKVMVMEDFVVARVGELCFTTLSREDVINAVKRFSPAGANAGTPQDPMAEADRLLSDQTSAVALARNMNADYVLTVSLTSLVSQIQKFEGYGVQTEVLSQTLDATYRLLDRAQGTVIDSGSASATEQLRGTPNLQQGADLIDPLIKQVAANLTAVMAKQCKARTLPPPAALDGAGFTVSCTMLDVNVPNIVMDPASNRYTVAANPLSVSPLGVAVDVDGITVGTTPNAFRTTPGLHKLRLRGPGFKPWEATVNITDGFDLRVALQMDADTYARWLTTTKVLQDLKQGQQLTDAQVEVLRGVAQFFANSQYVVNYKVDTKQAPPLVVPGFWGGGVVPPVGP